MIRLCDLPAARIHPSTLAHHGQACEGADRIVVGAIEYRLVLSESVAVGKVICEQGRLDVDYWLEGPVN